MKNKYRNAVVTGASSGIGAEIAKYLARNNCHVVAVARNGKNLKRQKLFLSKRQQQYFHPFATDINDTESHKRIISKAFKRGDIDLFISNAGVGISKSFIKMSNKEIDYVMNTNLQSPIKLTREILDSNLIDSKAVNLQIVFVTSMAGKMGFPKLSTYTATKFGLEGFVEALRHDLKNSSVSICILRPGITDTNFFASAGMNDFHKSVKGKSVLHSPESVAIELFNLLSSKLEELTIGTDRYVVKILPFFGWKMRLKVLDIINKF